MFNINNFSAKTIKQLYLKFYWTDFHDIVSNASTWCVDDPSIEKSSKN